MNYLLERYYPSTETFLIGSVKDADLFEYVFHGFVLCLDADGKEEYYSCSWNAPMIAVLKTPEIDEIFRKKESDKNNISQFIHLLARLKHIQIHYGDSQVAWDMIQKELAKTEHHQTLASYNVTIDCIIGRMFPGYAQ
jgi:hypothetical protein